MYVKLMLTLLVVATAMLAFRVSRPAVVVAPIPAPPGSAEAALDREMDPLPIWDLTVESAVRKLQIVGKVKLDVDWDALAKAGIHRGDPIVGHTNSSPFREIIETTLTASHPGIRLVCEGEGDTVSVTTETAFAKGLTVRTYDVRDLLTDNYWGIAVAPAEIPDTQQGHMYSLVFVIETSIGEGTWDNPSVATIQTWAGRLIVMQTPRNHHKIERMLATLRQMR
jgi:hypothetical protein